MEKAAELGALAERYPLHLSMVTAQWPQLPELLASLNAIDPGRLRVDAIAWSTDATWQALESADLAWIPVAAAGEKAMKSPNRLLESLWAGRLVVADEVPSYLPFADVTPVGVPLADAMRSALAGPAAVEAKIAEAQRRIAAAHSPYECARAWARALGDTAERPLRLNLGCGDKILPGYVNVDVVESRAGMRPDVICDLHDLAPFADASADEILSVHVVEHFWRWEVRDILREWTRVLKPGGRMVIECPNLESACRTFLENPAQFSREDQGGQRTMWVFYGDPAWKDPLMIHRWGYTPESLKRLLSDVGLAEVRQEPAQFKLREPRDMRIVGVKP
jgi:SAM-dependent methyltransferase